MGIQFETRLDRLLQDGSSPTDIARAINRAPLGEGVARTRFYEDGSSEVIGRSSFIRDGVRYVTQQLNPLNHLRRFSDATPLKLLGASMLGAKAFLSLNVSALAASGSATAIGVAFAFVAGAAVPPAMGSAPSSIGHSISPIE